MWVCLRQAMQTLSNTYSQGMVPALEGLAQTVLTFAWKGFQEK